MKAPESILALFLLLGPALAQAQPAGWASAPGQVKTESRRYEAAGGVTVDAVEGWLAVPENRSRRDSRLIEVHFVRLRSTSASPAAPIFFLAGGPGNLGTTAVTSPEALSAWAGLLGHADVVLIDQRGTRDRDLAHRWAGPFPERFFERAEIARAHAAALSKQAVAEISRRGVDLSGYTTEESAADLEQLRVALGTGKISLIGFSYGTHLALAYLRRHESRVERAVLAGVEGPDQTFKPPLSMDTHFRRIGRLAGEDEAIARTVPDLEALLERVDRQLAARPMLVPVTLPGGVKRELPVGRFGLHLVLRADIGDATDLPVLPRLLHSIERGDPSVLAWFVQKRLAFALAAPGMGLMMDAAAGASRERMALLEEQSKVSRFADVVNYPFPEIVPIWNPPAAPDDYHRPVSSRVPTLFLSGEYDWNAPPYQAEEARWGFAHATHLVVANAGHEQTLWNPDSAPAVLGFLRGEAVAADAIRYPPLRFAPLEGPSDAHPSLAGGARSR